MSIERLKQNLIFRPIAYLLVLILAGTPIGNVIAETVRDRPEGAAQANELGRLLLETPPTFSNEGGVMSVNPGGDREQSFSASQLAPGATSFNVDEYSAVYGSGSAMVTGGATARADMDADTGTQGSAYDVLKHRRMLGQPDLRSDPIWGMTDSIRANIDDFAEDFLDCAVEETLIPVTRSYHEPDLRECERATPLFEGTCTLTHDLQVESFPYEGIVPNLNIPITGASNLGIYDEGSFGCWGARCSTYYVTLVMARNWDPSLGTEVHVQGVTYGHCSMDDEWCRSGTTAVGVLNGIYEVLFYRNNTVSIRVPAPTHPGEWSCNIEEYDSDYYTTCSAWDGYGSYRASPIDSSLADGARIRIVDQVQVDFKTGTIVGFPGTVGESLDYADMCGEPLRQYSAQVSSVSGDGEVIVLPSCANDLMGTIRLRRDRDLPTSFLLRWYRINNDEWFYADPACEAAMITVEDGVCTADVTCTSAGTGCVTVSGVRLCDHQLNAPPSPFVGIGGSCLTATAQINCSAGIPESICDVDFEGEEICYDTSGADPSTYTGTCSAYESDPRCAYVSRACVEDDVSDSGACHSYIETWDCGHSVDIEEDVLERSLICAGPVRCMGEDCVEQERETSTSMQEAIVALQSAQYMMSDMECADGWDCMVFNGERMSCHRYLWGIQNCCKTPSGVSLVDYIQLMRGAYKLDQAVGVSDYLLSTAPGEVMRSGYDKIVTETGNMWSKVSSGFTSTASNVTGSATAQASDATASLALSEFKQNMINKTAEWVGTNFGSSVQGMFFESTGGGVFTMTGPISTVAGYVMMVYMYYQIFVIIVSILLDCNRESQELGVKRELRSCHYAGTRCTNKTFFGTCTRRTSTYCCFSSPLARIINQQVRNQIGGFGWGSAAAPNCSGIPLSMFETINWSLVDLSEWMAILASSGALPTTANVSIEKLTGTGSSLNVGSTPRADAETRTRERLENIDGMDVHWKSTQELFSMPVE